MARVSSAVITIMAMPRTAMYVIGTIGIGTTDTVKGPDRPLSLFKLCRACELRFP
jgi:hypothetical protein